MNELRWNPLLDEWVVIASRRQTRPILRSECPFCPGAPEAEGDWVVKSLPNRFPALSPEAPKVSGENAPYRLERAYGVCEVLLETKEHSKDLADLEPENIVELIGLYRQRYEELGMRADIKYVSIFRNKGELIGVSLHHPHGQLYAFPFIPPLVERKLRAASSYMETTGKCLYCEVASKEAGGPRLVARNDAYVCHVPFAPRFAYQTSILPLRHVGGLSEMDSTEIRSLAAILKTILMKYNRLFGFSLPYVMVLYNTPTDGREHPYHHFHIEIMPRHRSRDQIKYIAGAELGSGVYINDGPPEERAAELRSL